MSEERKRKSSVTIDDIPAGSNVTIKMTPDGEVTVTIHKPDEPATPTDASIVAGLAAR